MTCCQRNADVLQKQGKGCCPVLLRAPVAQPASSTYTRRKTLGLGAERSAEFNLERSRAPPGGWTWRWERSSSGSEGFLY